MPAKAGTQKRFAPRFHSERGFSDPSNEGARKSKQRRDEIEWEKISLRKYSKLI
jgi:hypothetical protein